jgi:hypothetical protein
MEVDFVKNRITLTEDEAKVAAAFVDDSATEELLRAEIRRKEDTRKGYMQNNGISEALARKRFPSLYDYAIPYINRNELIDAYLFATNAVPEDMQGIVENYEADQVKQIGRSACVELVAQAAVPIVHEKLAEAA